MLSAVLCYIIHPINIIPIADETDKIHTPRPLVIGGLLPLTIIDAGKQPK